MLKFRQLGSHWYKAMIFCYACYNFLLLRMIYTTCKALSVFGHTIYVLFETVIRGWQFQWNGAINCEIRNILGISFKLRLFNSGWVAKRTCIILTHMQTTYFLCNDVIVLTIDIKKKKGLNKVIIYLSQYKMTVSSLTLLNYGICYYL